MSLCQSCSRAIFNQLWGEYRCRIDDKSNPHAVIVPHEVTECDGYKKGEITISKNDEVEDDEEDL